MRVDPYTRADARLGCARSARGRQRSRSGGLGTDRRGGPGPGRLSPARCRSDHPALRGRGERRLPPLRIRDEWRQYFDGEVERMTLLVAHVEQAWVEAKRVGDDDVRRAAKAPRRRLNEVPGAIEKLKTCAADHGASFSPIAIWDRIEREATRRQETIALPR